MMVDIEQLRSLVAQPHRQELTPRDACLYALSLGCTASAEVGLQNDMDGRCRDLWLAFCASCGVGIVHTSMHNPYAQDLRLTYERHPVFEVLPTYAIIAAHPSLSALLSAAEHGIPGFTRASCSVWVSTGDTLSARPR
jgi:hypothetical protein